MNYDRKIHEKCGKYESHTFLEIQNLPENTKESWLIFYYLTGLDKAQEKWPML
jgi:hypothetical protein